MIFVDTGYLLALLNSRDQLHPRALAWASFVAEPLVVTEYVIWEMLNGFSSPADRAKAHAALEEIQASVDWDLIAASVQLFAAGISLHRERPDKEWSLTDCISFVVMRKYTTKSWICLLEGAVPARSFDFTPRPPHTSLSALRSRLPVPRCQT